MMRSLFLLSIAFAPAVFGRVPPQWGHFPTRSTTESQAISATSTPSQSALQASTSSQSALQVSTSITSTLSASIPSASTSSDSTSSDSTSSDSTSSEAASTGWEYLISFGDSYSQTGFSISGTKATAGNILGNPAFPGYTTTNGDNWIDYAIATYNKSVVLSYNFAYGGATTDASLVTPYASTVLSFVDQTSEFSKNLVPAPSYAKWTGSNALFAVWIGVNDVGNAWSKSDWTTLASEIISKYVSQVQIMYNAGARNFLILTVPPTQYTPSVVADGTTTQTEWGNAVAYYNKLLTAAIATFKSDNSGSTVYVYDTSTPFLKAIDDPKAYGAPDATCYNSNGVSCLWWNNYHPGQAIHKLVAQGVSSLTGI